MRKIPKTVRIMPKDIRISVGYDVPDEGKLVCGVCVGVEVGLIVWVGEGEVTMAILSVGAGVIVGTGVSVGSAVVGLGLAVGV